MKDILRTHDVAADDVEQRLRTADTDLRGKVKAAQERGRRDLKATKLQSSLAAARAQLQQENAKFFGQLRRVEDKFEVAKSIISGSAVALYMVLIVAAVAVGVAYRKHKALGEALKDLASSQALHGQLDDPLL